MKLTDIKTEDHLHDQVNEQVCLQIHNIVDCLLFDHLENIHDQDYDKVDEILFKERVYRDAYISIVGTIQ
jgi:hypothetical protein